MKVRTSDISKKTTLPFFTHCLFRISLCRTTTAQLLPTIAQDNPANYETINKFIEKYHNRLVDLGWFM
jgi:hypothetical protein